MGKTVLIAGATGMTGGLVLNQCLHSSQISCVISIVRKKTSAKHKKLKEIVHPDFSDFSKLKKEVKNIDVAYYCVGVYTGQFPDSKFKQITVDYLSAFASVLKKQSPHATFCLMSAAGADRTEKSPISFARFKGMAENIVLQLQFDYAQFFRPNYIYPVTPRHEPNFNYRLFRKLYPLLNVIYPNGSITSEQLAKVIFEQGLIDQNKTFSNKEMRML